MSPAMWDVLRSVKLYRGGYSRPPGTLEILARRGFIEMAPRPDANGFYSARLTAAGVEALGGGRDARERKSQVGPPGFVEVEIIDPKAAVVNCAIDLS